MLTATVASSSTASVDKRPGSVTDSSSSAAGPNSAMKRWHSAARHDLGRFVDATFRRNLTRQLGEDPRRPAKLRGVDGEALLDPPLRAPERKDRSELADRCVGGVGLQRQLVMPPRGVFFAEPEKGLSARLLQQGALDVVLRFDVSDMIEHELRIRTGSGLGDQQRRMVGNQLARGIEMTAVALLRTLRAGHRRGPDVVASPVGVADGDVARLEERALGLGDETGRGQKARSSYQQSVRTLVKIADS